MQHFYLLLALSLFIKVMVLKMAAGVPRVGPWPLGLETTEKIFVHKELCLSILTSLGIALLYVEGQIIVLCLAYIK